MLSNQSKSALIRAIRSNYPDMPVSWYEYMADMLTRELDARLEVNVVEFCEGRPLTDVWFSTSDGRQYSVDSIMAIHGNSDFLDAITVLNLLATGNEALALSQIYRTRL